MPTALFYAFTAIMLGFGLLVVFLRNPVSNALSLVMSFVGLAALFVSLDAYFIGIIQILVYAGAVMVLFLFIIMLLDIRAEQRRKIKPVPVVGGGLLVFGFVVLLGYVLSGHEAGARRMNDAKPDFALAQKARAEAGLSVATIEKDLAAGEVPDAKLVGEVLFSRYYLHLQIIGVLLLSATVGVVILSRREERTYSLAESTRPVVAPPAVTNATAETASGAAPSNPGAAS